MELSNLTAKVYDQLLPELNRLEDERLEQKRKVGFYTKMGFVLILVFILLFFPIKKYATDQHPWHWYTLFAGLFISALPFFRGINIVTRFNKSIKNSIIGTLLNHLSPDLHYKQEAKIEKDEFLSSQLFTKADKYEGEDLIEGKWENIRLRLSEVNAEQRLSGRLDGKTRYQDLFKGLFLVAEFPEHFPTKTLILPNDTEEILGHQLGKILQSFSFDKGELLSLNDPAFDQTFRVYSHGFDHSRQLLNSTFRRDLLLLKERLRSYIRLSFIKDKVYIAIMTGQEFLEPDFHSPINERKLIDDLLEQILSALQIIEDLNLNHKT